VSHSTDFANRALRNAVRQAAIWVKKGVAPLVVAVNLSAVQFRQPDFPKMVSRILEEEGLPANYLELELTEGLPCTTPWRRQPY
jgi:diguanylate cyclase/phosphodiesterase with PAS/PAC sensor(s)